MLLEFFLFFNWCAGLSLTGPVVDFYGRQIKETEGEWENDIKKEREWREWERRQTCGGVQELRWPCSPGALSAPAFIFHCHTAPFTLFLSGFFPCFYFPGIIFLPACACCLSCSLHLPLSFVSLFVFFLQFLFFNQRNVSIFLLLIYGLYIMSQFPLLFSGKKVFS